MIGKVSYYDQKKRKFGFIHDAAEPIFIPSQQIVDGFKYLRVGDLIDFEVTNGIKSLRASLVKIVKPYRYSRKFNKNKLPTSDFEMVFYHISIHPEDIGRNFVHHVAWLPGKKASTSVLLVEEFELKPNYKDEFSTSFISWDNFIEKLYHTCSTNPWWVEETKALGLEKLIGG